MTLPAPAAPFEWVVTAGGPALVCRPLAAVAPHVFTARDWLVGGTSANSGAAAAGEPDGERGWDEVARAVNVMPSDLLQARQVHGIEVSVGRSGAAGRPQADILIARDEALAVAVRVADCVPLLIADVRTGAVAAVHAGWRGLAARAPVVAVSALTSEFGSRPGDLMAAFGPSIGACCYEVGPEVRQRFAASGCPPAALDRWFLERPIPSRTNPPLPGLASQGRDGRWYFDGWAAVRDQLADAGVQAARISGPDLCTASHPGAFCSFRRDGPGAGRMAAAIRSAVRRP
jgi:YfiH family protein